MSGFLQEPEINADTIDNIYFPKLKRREKVVIYDEDVTVNEMSIETDEISITKIRKNIDKMGLSELKKVANKLAIYQTKGGSEKLKELILDKLKTLEDYKTF